jgi:hypothetical protein
MSLNILVLHNLEDLAHARKSALDHVLAFQRYAPEHRYTVRPVSWPVNEALKTFPWDAVIFTSTALGIVTYRPRKLFEDRLSDWSFLAQHRALKIVFPQDDADHGALLDRFFEAISADYVFTVRPEFADFIYPRTVKIAKFESTFAGYLNDEDVERIPLFAKDFEAREVTLGQRVTLYPPIGGRLARLKGEAALAMKAAAIERGISEDISVDPQNVFLGDDWLRFLGNCKFVIGAEGGLGVWDPEGRINDSVREFTELNPEASFEEVEAACFPGVDGNPEFPGFSPRIFEAALLGCCQILVEGSYRGLLKPFEHYIPLKRDFSNFREIFVHMNDQALVRRLISNCFRDLVATEKFRYRTLVSRVIGAIQETRTESERKDFSHLSFEDRFPILELTERAWNEGFAWPGVADRVVSSIAMQQLPEISGYISPSDVHHQTKFRVFDALLQFVSATEPEDRRQGVAATLIVLGVPHEKAWLLDSLLRDPKHAELARFAEAAVSAPELAGLVSRIAPKTGARFEAAEVEKLKNVDEVIVRTSEAGLSSVLRQLAQGERVERLLEPLEANGHLSRLILALASAPGETEEMVARLAPASGDAFSPEEIEAMRRLNGFLSGRYGFAANQLMGLLNRNWAPLKGGGAEGG